MKKIDLFVTRDVECVTNIPPLFKRGGIAKLRTPYMTLTSYNENGEYNGFDIALVDINLEEGYAKFMAGTSIANPQTFTIKCADDPIVVFDEYDPGVEYHIFEKSVQYEINQDIKEGGLYKFQDAFTNEWFLAVVQCVETYQITLNKFDIMRDKTFSPTLYTLCQQPDIFGISTTDKFCIEKFKNYKVTELFDLTTAFGDDDEVDVMEEEDMKLDSWKDCVIKDNAWFVNDQIKDGDVIDRLKTDTIDIKGKMKIANISYGMIHIESDDTDGITGNINLGITRDMRVFKPDSPDNPGILVQQQKARFNPELRVGKLYHFTNSNKNIQYMIHVKSITDNAMEVHVISTVKESNGTSSLTVIGRSFDIAELLEYKFKEV